MNLLLLFLFDFLGDYDSVCKLISICHDNWSIDDFGQIIEYMIDRKHLLTTINYTKLITTYVSTLVNLDKLDHINNNTMKYIDYTKISIKDNINYIKVFECTLEERGEEILIHLHIGRLINRTDKKMFEDVEKYIKNMKATSHIKNYILVKYYTYITTKQNNHKIVIETIKNYS